jgi:molybdate transport system regulatory protein
MARATIRVDFEGRGSIGPGKIKLLETIGECGSIAAAARALRMSYRQAWLLTEDVAATLGVPAIVARSGGARGGHAELTPPALKAIKAYRGLERKTSRACAQELALLDQLANGPPREPARRPSLKRKRETPRQRS